MRQEIVNIIIETANELGEDEIGLNGSLTENTVLFGKDGALDSMGLVTLIIAVEQAIEDRFETSIGLADEKAMSQAKSPYRSVGSLADYALSQVEGA
jgi:acyl carrier protein